MVSLFRAGDINTIAEKLDFLANNDNSRIDFGNNSYSIIEKEFSEDKLIDNYLKLISEFNFPEVKENHSIDFMKIGVIGTRGFPDIQGGIETHCMELYTRIAGNSGNLVTVYRRKPYLNSRNRDAKFDNIRFVDFSVPRSKFLETFLHSFISTLHALFQRYDIVHYHNTGPGFFIPLLVFSRAKVVFTYHNVSYTQKKWNPAAKKFLSLSEKVSLNNSDYVIFISEVIKAEMLKKYSVNNYKVIFNGVCHPEISTQSDYLESLGLEKQKYAIAVGRFLEEKGL